MNVNMKKFTMELVWHNCLEYPPKETTNDSLIMTDGSDVFEASWYKPDGFMIRTKDEWRGVYVNQENWWWADVRQTVQGDRRFNEYKIYNEFLKLGYSEQDSFNLAGLAINTSKAYEGYIDVEMATKTLIDMFARVKMKANNSN